MKDRSSELLRMLSDFLKNIDNAGDADTKKIRQYYFDLSVNERNRFITLLYDSIKDIKPLLFQLLTLFSGGNNNTYAMKLMGKTALDADFSLEELIRIFIQYRHLSFVSSSDIREELISLYIEIYRRLNSYFSPSYDYTKYENRNNKKILLVTDQLLSERHAPTQILINQWYYLVKAGYEVELLIVSESKITPPELWIGPYVEMNNMPAPKGRFTLEYYDKKIEGTNLFLETSNLAESITEALDTIRDYNPAFIISIGEMNLIADIASMFTTVVSKTTTKNIPFTMSKYVMYRDIVEYDGFEKNMREDIVVLQDYFVNVLVPPEEGNEDIIESIKDDDRFKILIVGNRLDAEISNDFLKNLHNLVDNCPNLAFVVVGACDGFKAMVQESNYSEHYIFTGYAKNLSGITKECDVFLNPPREGGGFSAEIALKNGVPVITLGNCDVAEWAGPEYICNNIASMIDDIKKCLNDSVYMKERSQKAIERWKSRTLSEQEGIDNTKAFYEKLVEYIKNDELS